MISFMQETGKIQRIVTRVYMNQKRIRILGTMKISHKSQSSEAIASFPLKIEIDHFKANKMSFTVP